MFDVFFYLKRDDNYIIRTPKQTFTYGNYINLRYNRVIEPIGSVYLCNPIISLKENEQKQFCYHFIRSQKRSFFR